VGSRWDGVRIRFAKVLCAGRRGICRTTPRFRSMEVGWCDDVKVPYLLDYSCRQQQRMSLGHIRYSQTRDSKKMYDNIQYFNRHMRIGQRDGRTVVEKCG
jgi:hypothetical protein